MSHQVALFLHHIVNIHQLFQLLQRSLPQCSLPEDVPICLY